MTAARVIKLGGSLLDWPGLAAEFWRWLAAQPQRANIVIAGGGELVEAIRALDRAQPLAPDVAHWASIRAMGIHAAIAAEWLEGTLVTRLEDLRLTPPSGLQVFDPEQFLRATQGCDGGLPCGWEVTSDSIAARVASVVEAEELVLLKSSLPKDRVASLESWSRLGFVDAHFVSSARGLGVRAVNLRDDGFPELVLDLRT